MVGAGTLDLVARAGQSGESALWALDVAVNYLRRFGHRVLPVYLVAMGPFSAAVLWLIDAIAAQDQSVLPFGCALLVLATLWRWGWLSVVQWRVQRDCRGEPPLLLRRRLAAILLLRLLAATSITWGLLLIIPFFYGFFAAGFIAPLLLEWEGPATARVFESLQRLQDARERLGRVLGALAAAGLAALVTAVVWHLLLLGTLLTSILGFETADIALTLRGTSWVLAVGYFLFVVFDVFWTVASVILFYDLQARRLGSDLRLRLRALREAA
jgi:hypothetical protein